MMSTPFKILDENDTVTSSRAKNTNTINNNPIKGGGLGGGGRTSPLKPGAPSALGAFGGGNTNIMNGGGGGGGGKDGNKTGITTARKALVDLSHSQVNGGLVNTRTLGAQTPSVSHSSMSALGGISRNIMNTAFKSNKKPRKENNSSSNSNINSISVFEDAVVETECSAEVEDSAKYDSADMIAEMICSRVDKTSYADPYDIVMDSSKSLHYRFVPTTTEGNNDGGASMEQSPGDLYYFNGNYTEDIEEICRKLEEDNSDYNNSSSEHGNSNNLCCSTNPDAVTESYENFSDI